MMKAFVSALVLLCSLCTFAQHNYRIADIAIEGNEKTKPQTILREFRYSVGDTIPADEVEAELSVFVDNLRRLMLFNDITVSYSLAGTSDIVVEVSLVERWYYWVYPILEIADRNLTSYFYYRDFRRLNYGAAFDWLNFRGRNEMLNFKVRFGFREHYAVSYQKPNIGRSRSHGIWVKAEYFRQKKDIAYISDNKPVYVENIDGYIRNSFDAGVGYVFRPQTNYDFSLSFTYQNIVSKDSMLFEQMPYRQNFFIPAFDFDYDTRDSKVCPKKGFHADFGAKVFVDLESNVFAFTNVDFEYNCNVYKDRLYYHGAIACRHFFGDEDIVPDNKRIELCRDYLVRGFDYYYITGRNFTSMQNTFSVKLLNKRDFSLPRWIPKKFRQPYIQIFMDIFADVAYSSNFADVFETGNTLSQVPIWSAGAGLSFETYYDRVLNVYVAYNGNFNNIGVFVNYITPIYKKF